MTAFKIFSFVFRRFLRASLTLLFVLALMSVACSPNPPASKLTPITVQLSWLHQAQSAGFYAAIQQGYFAEEGLDVSFLEGGPEVDYISPVIDGTAQFGIAPAADLILARAAGKPVRSVAVIFRRNPTVFFTLADSGITRPQDFVNKKIRSALGADQTLRAMMANVGVRPDQYEIVYLPSDVELFSSGDVPVWAGFLNALVLDVQQAGHEINIIYPDDYGIHFYGDTLFTTDELIASDPDLVQRFTRATLRGWTYVVENPETVGALVHDYNPDTNPELETAKMVTSIPLVNTGEDFIGWMKQGTWDAMAQTLREQGTLTQPLDVTQVYTMQFLEEMYGQ